MRGEGSTTNGWGGGGVSGEVRDKQMQRRGYSSCVIYTVIQKYCTLMISERLICLTHILTQAFVKNPHQLTATLISLSFIMECNVHNNRSKKKKKRGHCLHGKQNCVL